MINNIIWPLALCCHIASIFTLRRIIKEIWRNLSTIEKDVRRGKIDTHNVVNESADNRLNILADKAECKASWKNIDTIKARLEDDCKSRQTEGIEMYNGQLNYAKREWNKKFEEINAHLKEHDSRIGDRDDAVAQRFSDVYEYIEHCKKDRSFIKEAMQTLKKPKGSKKKSAHKELDEAYDYMRDIKNPVITVVKKKDR